jgi:hypothetical protein
LVVDVLSLSLSLSFKDFLHNNCVTSCNKGMENHPPPLCACSVLALYNQLAGGV